MVFEIRGVAKATPRQEVFVRVFRSGPVSDHRLARFHLAAVVMACTARKRGDSHHKLAQMGRAAAQDAVCRGFESRACTRQELDVVDEDEAELAPHRGDLAIRAGKGGSQRARSHELPVSAASEVRDASKGHAPQIGARGRGSRVHERRRAAGEPRRGCGYHLDLLDTAAAMGPRRRCGRKENGNVGFEAIVGGAVRTCAGVP